MDNSPFGALPPELRNCIYTLVMSENLFVVHPKRKNKGKLEIVQQGVGVSGRRDLGWKIAKGLRFASVCRQIRQESAALFYAVNTFVFKGFDTLTTFIKIIGERNTRALGSFEIDHFAVTRIPKDQAYQGNKAARGRIQTLQQFAKNYAWVSVKVTGDFQQYGVSAGGSFEIMNGGTRWENRIGWPYNSTYIQQDAFLSGICDELRAWKEIFEQLQ